MLRWSALSTARPLSTVPATPSTWTDADVRALLVEMLLALEREKNPGGEAPSAVSLRGFSWIVSPASGGVLLHLEVQIGTASAGPFSIGERKLIDMITRVMSPAPTSSAVH